MTVETRIIMGMPITLDIPNSEGADIHERVFDVFNDADKRFSPFRPDSEVSRFNSGEIDEPALSSQMRDVLKIAHDMQEITDGYFDIRCEDGTIDPSGVVKGWAILGAARLLERDGFGNFCIDAGGDIQVGGRDARDREWSIGIRNPFDPRQIVKAIAPRGQGVATSGNYVRGDHIYDPHDRTSRIEGPVSITVIGHDVLVADLHATAAFAMGDKGIYYIETLDGVEAYQIHQDGTAVQTTGFKEFVFS
ncbi:FAD:protein FMN transferase [Thioclava sp. F28-4]|uniref:FAD:protein FMN transferase n=1 Tax=Thioclava sp. F28-4 TaxID=1915315 RepID=UPI0009979A80|nr:FAD:protein FMN transferase [Thioclava sp. F28-4]OOY06775.1 hypothetical protein BMI87_04660 [Thioclava sp. F28-4]